MRHCKLNATIHDFFLVREHLKSWLDVAQKHALEKSVAAAGCKFCYGWATFRLINKSFLHWQNCAATSSCSRLQAIKTIIFVLMPKAKLRILYDCFLRFRRESALRRAKRLVNSVEETTKKQNILQEALYQWQDETMLKQRPSTNSSWTVRMNGSDKYRETMLGSNIKDMDGNAKDSQLVQTFLNSWQEVAERNTNNFARCLWTFTCWNKEVGRICQYRRKLLKGIIMSKSFNFMNSYFKAWCNIFKSRSIRPKIP
eukprot:750942-Hanusia_phi.AAC.2